MRQGMEPMKHQRNPNKGAWQSDRRKEKRHDQWKAQKRAQKRQMREW